jgi:hypothetical protein
MKALIKHLLLLRVLLLALSPHKTTRADIGPDPVTGYGGLQPFQDQPTEVEMVYERVEMELKAVPLGKGDETPDYKVDTVAWFVMHNQGTRDESMRVIFPLWDLNWCMTNTAPRIVGPALS